MAKIILIPENDGIHYVVAKVPICKRCHRKLKTPEAIERGMGKVCSLRCVSDVRKPLFNKFINKHYKP